MSRILWMELHVVPTLADQSIHWEWICVDRSELREGARRVRIDHGVHPQDVLLQGFGVRLQVHSPEKLLSDELHSPVAPLAQLFRGADRVVRFFRCFVAFELM